MEYNRDNATEVLSERTFPHLLCSRALIKPRRRKSQLHVLPQYHTTVTILRRCIL